MAKKNFKKKLKKRKRKKRKKKKKTDTGSPYHSRSISFTNVSRISTPSDSGKRSQRAEVWWVPSPLGKRPRPVGRFPTKQSRLEEKAELFNFILSLPLPPLCPRCAPTSLSPLRKKNNNNQTKSAQAILSSLLTLTSVCIFSILFSIHFFKCL